MRDERDEQSADTSYKYASSKLLLSCGFILHHYVDLHCHACSVTLKPVYRHITHTHTHYVGMWNSIWKNCIHPHFNYVIIYASVYTFRTPNRRWWYFWLTHHHQGHCRECRQRCDQWSVYSCKREIAFIIMQFFIYLDGRSYCRIKTNVCRSQPRSTRAYNEKEFVPCVVPSDYRTNTEWTIDVRRTVSLEEWMRVTVIDVAIDNIHERTLSSSPHFQFVISFNYLSEDTYFLSVVQDVHACTHFRIIWQIHCAYMYRP